MFKNTDLRLHLTAVVATDENNAIGKDNNIPWDSPTDMNHFSRQTYGGVCIVGSKTYRSFKKPLSGRRLIVVTRTPEDYPSKLNTYFVSDVERALALADKLTFGGKVWVIGGGEIYKMFAPYTKRVLHSTIEGCRVHEPDTYFDWSIYDDSVEIVPFSFALRGKITKFQQQCLDDWVHKYGHLVHHVKKYQGTNGIYIGRPSLFRNRFTHLDLDKVTGDDIVKVETRELAVIKWHQDWLNTLRDDPVFNIGKLRELKGKDLLCWCSNGTNSLAEGAKYCHGHALAALVDRYVR